MGTGTKMDNTDVCKNHKKAWDLLKMYHKIRSMDLLQVQEGVIYCDKKTIKKNCKSRLLITIDDPLKDLHWQ